MARQAKKAASPKKASPVKAKVTKAKKSPAKAAAAPKGRASPKKRSKKEKDPNAPKRGKSAYMFWLAENRARLTKPGMGITDVTKAAGVEWGTVKDKTKWEKLAADDKKRYEKESAVYKKKH